MGERLIKKWQDLVVTRIVKDAKRSVVRSHSMQGIFQLQEVHDNVHLTHSEGPSVQMFQALLSLSENVHDLGIVYHPIGQHAIVQNLLRSFIAIWVDEIWIEGLDKFLPDIALLRYISDRYGESWSDISSKLAAKEKEVVRNLSPSQPEPFIEP